MCYIEIEKFQMVVLSIYSMIHLMLTRSIQDSETSIDFVQGPPGSRRERVNPMITNWFWYNTHFL